MTSFSDSAQFVIGMYGDSTTWGAEFLASGQWVQSSDNVPSIIQEKYPSGVTVLNKGISGVTMPQMVIGAYPAKKPWVQEMAESSADIVVLNFGINDANQSWEVDFQIDHYFRQLIDIAQSAGKLVVVETSNPINNPLYNRLSEISEIIRNIAKSKSLTLADHHLWIQTGVPAWNSVKYLPDGVHPSSELYRYKAESLFKVLGPLVKSISGV